MLLCYYLLHECLGPENQKLALIPNADMILERLNLEHTS